MSQDFPEYPTTLNAFNLKPTIVNFNSDLQSTPTFLSPSFRECHFCEKLYVMERNETEELNYGSLEVGVEGVFICYKCEPEALRKRWKKH